jgi:hypothetical protein
MCTTSRFREAARRMTAAGIMYDGKINRRATESWFLPVVLPLKKVVFLSVTRWARDGD